MINQDQSVSLKVATLNAWGIPGPSFLCKDRAFRMNKIAQELANSEYDLVALQEIWSESDYLLIKTIVTERFPFSHYFHSGFIGSGVCMFSRYVIESALMHRYSLNGFAHHIHRGDWFGGKVVGLLQITIPSASRPLRVNFYSTHIHAEYDRINDLYLPHRIVQSYELSQFVKHTARGADLLLVTGDLNLEPDDLGMKLVLCNAQLNDTFLETTMPCTDEHQGNTCDRPDNQYTMEAMAKECPHGKRIDYVLYRADDDMDCSVVRADVCLDHIDGSALCYSDHAGVSAQFKLTPLHSRKDGTPMSPAVVNHDNTLNTHLEKAVQMVEQGETRVNSDIRLFVCSLVIMVFLYFLSIDIELTVPALAVPAVLIRLMLSLIIGFCLWYGVIGLRLEAKALKAAKLAMLLAKDKPNIQRN